MKILKEIIGSSAKDCEIIENIGADRIELCSNLEVGGLSPSISLLDFVRSQINIPIATMLRPRAGGFVYNRDEVNFILFELKQLLKTGADAIVFGCLTKESLIDFELLRHVIEIVHSRNKQLVFHRAFDCMPTHSVYSSTEKLIELGVDRILTSGLEKTAIGGAKVISKLQKDYGSEIEILPASGINGQNLKELIYKTRVNQAHSSCSSVKIDLTGDKIGSSEYIALDLRKAKLFVNA